MVFRSDDAEPVTTTTDDDKTTDDTADQSNAVYDMIADGVGEAVYVGAIVDGGFVSALATNDAEREFAAAVADAADDAIGVFISGPACRLETVGRPARVREGMRADVFDRFEHVGLPTFPTDLEDPELRTVMAAYQALGGGSNGGSPLMG